MITYEVLDPLLEVGKISKLVVAEGEERFGKDFNPNLYMLLKMAECGNLRIFVVKEDDEIIGFANFSLGQHMFKAHVRQADCIAFYVTPSKRGGVYARNLMKFAEKCLKERDWVNLIISTTNDWGKFEKFYGRLGFKRLNVVVGKEL